MFANAFSGLKSSFPAMHMSSRFVAIKLRLLLWCILSAILFPSSVQAAQSLTIVGPGAHDQSSSADLVRCQLGQRFLALHEGVCTWVRAGGF